MIGALVSILLLTVASVAYVFALAGAVWLAAEGMIWASDRMMYGPPPSAEEMAERREVLNRMYADAQESFHVSVMAKWDEPSILEQLRGTSDE